MLLQRNESGLTSKELEAYNSIKPGMYLYGYCGGRFGRDSYGDKLVVSKTIDSVTVMEDGVKNCSFQIHSWLDLVNSSNSSLKEDEYE